MRVLRVAALVALLASAAVGAVPPAAAETALTQEACVYRAADGASPSETCVLTRASGCYRAGVYQSAPSGGRGRLVRVCPSLA